MTIIDRFKKFAVSDFEVVDKFLYLRFHINNNEN